MTANVSYLALVVINFTRAQKREKSQWVDLQEEDVGEQHSPQAGARGKSCAGQKTWSCRRLEKRLATRRGVRLQSCRIRQRCLDGTVQAAERHRKASCADIFLATFGGRLSGNTERE